MTATETQGTQLITPDFSGVQDRVGPGIYKVRVIDGKVGQWAGKDGKPATDFINWRMETFGEAEDKNNGRSIFHRTPINGGGAFRFQDFYRATMGEDCKGAFDISMFYGREVEVTIAEQRDNPQYTEVKSVRSLKH